MMAPNKVLRGKTYRPLKPMPDGKTARLEAWRLQDQGIPAHATYVGEYPDARAWIYVEQASGL